MKLKIDDLAELLGKTRREVEEILNKQEVLELKLSERKSTHKEDDDDLRIYE